MSLAKILAAKKPRKRRFYNGGDADPEGNADAGRPDGSPSVGGFNGPDVSNPEPGQAPGVVNDAAFGGGSPTGGSGPEPGQAPGTVNNAAFAPTPGENTPTPTSAPTTMDRVIEALGIAGKVPGTFGMLAAGLGTALEYAKADRAARESDSARFGISMPASVPQESGMGDSSGIGAGTANPFGSSAPTQTTPAAPADAGMRRYVWDPVARQYTLTNVGGGANPMGYTSGQTFRMAGGGQAPSGIAAGAPLQPRFVQGGGTGLSDDVPVKMDDGGEGRLADGEFVIPADVVSGLGGGSSKAGADMLYQMMERIRQMAHGKSEQIRPVDPAKVMPA
jgi:hypothetical protein